MVEHTVQDDLHPALMNLGDEIREESIARLEVVGIGHALDVTVGVTVVMVALVEEAVVVMKDYAVVGIHVVIVLNVVFVIGRRNEDGVQVQDLNTELLQIVKLLQDTL